MCAHRDGKCAAVFVEIDSDNRSCAHNPQGLQSHPSPIAPQPITRMTSPFSGRPSPGVLKPNGKVAQIQAACASGMPSGTSSSMLLIKQHQFAEAARAFVAIADHLVRPASAHYWH